MNVNYSYSHFASHLHCDQEFNLFQQYDYKHIDIEKK